jgi:hypothetical protein
MIKTNDSITMTMMMRMSLNAYFVFIRLDYLIDSSEFHGQLRGWFYVKYHRKIEFPSIDIHEFRKSLTYCKREFFTLRELKSFSALKRVVVKVLIFFKGKTTKKQKERKKVELSNGVIMCEKGKRRRIK